MRGKEWLPAALPGALVAVAALLGWVPQARDLPAYFLPLREYTARVLRGEASPFWLEQVGCGEPFFANPQSALLYPLAWLGLLLPPGTAVGVEVGVHLALLGVGTALLARRLGATGWWSLAAGLGVVGAGPVMDSAGVLNNLTALTWLPWSWEAALAQARRRCAVFAALAFFAGEPQLAAIGAAVCLLLAPSRRSALALAFAGGVLAVQALPFAFWVAGGDRGAVVEVEEVARGALPAHHLATLLFPGGTVAGEFPFVVHPTLPLWAVLGTILALARPGPGRRMALAGVAGVVVAVGASTPLGGQVWAMATLGLVRYPARLLLPAAVMSAVVAAAALSRGRWRGTAGVAAALGLAGVGALVGGAPLAASWQGLAAGFAPVAPWGSWAAVAASLALTAGHLPALALAPLAVPPVACLAEQRAATRIYLVEPSHRMFTWVGQDPAPRTAALGLGYVPLHDGRRTVRTFAPLASAALAAHLREADRGPEGRWWLDTLAADTVVSLNPIAGFPLRCAAQGLVVSSNPQAWAPVAVVARMPEVGQAAVVVGEVLGEERRGDGRRWRVKVGGEGGVLLRLETPDRGWRYRVDGVRVAAVEGPGILHGVPLPPGSQVVEASYRPRGLLVGVAVTLLALIGVLWSGWGGGDRGEGVKGG